MNSTYKQIDFIMDLQIAFTKQSNQLPVADSIASMETPCIDHTQTSTPFKDNGNDIFLMNEYEYTFGHTDVINTINKCRANDFGIHFDPRYQDALSMLPLESPFNVTLFDMQDWNGII